MNAPEKLYILPRQGGDYAPYWKTDNQDDFGIEYIRKDALLEWLEVLKAQSLKLREAGYGDVFYGAQIAILEETIHKIESL